MKQRNKYSNTQARIEGLEKSRRNVSSTKWVNCFKHNIAGCSLKRVDTSKGYERDLFKVLQSLRVKGIVINDGSSTLTINLSSDTDIKIPPKHIWIGLGKDVGNGTKGKLQFLTSQGFSVFM